MQETSPRNDPFSLVGVTIDGQYRVDAVIGEGGFGVVYRGWHYALDQPIAIKALKVPDSDSTAYQDAILTKFRDEAKLLYTLSQTSLNIVRAMNFGGVVTPSGVWAPYMILEWLEGRSLAEDLEARRHRGMRGRSIDEAFAILAPAAAGLSVAHQRRVLHRDIKPGNVFLLAAQDGPRVKVLDFGIAKVLREDGSAGTRSKFASFTWLYAAPEQLDARIAPPSLATDVYSFALLATELLTDRAPTESRDVVSLVKAATDPTIRPTPRQRGAHVPDALEAVCRRALAVDPAARFASIDEFWAALESTRHAPPAPIMTRAIPSSSYGALPVATPTGGVAPPFGHVVSGTSPPVGTSPPTGMLAAAPPTTSRVMSPPAGSSPPAAGPSQSWNSPPAGTRPPGYAPQVAVLPTPAPMMSPVAPPPRMQIPSRMSQQPPQPPPPPQMVHGQGPPRTGIPTGTWQPPYKIRPTSGSSTSMVVAIVFIVVAMLFAFTCAAMHSACG